MPDLPAPPLNCRRSPPTPEQVVCSMSMAERCELLEDLGFACDVHSAALLVTMIKQTGSVEAAIRAVGVPQGKAA